MTYSADYNDIYSLYKVHPLHKTDLLIHLSWQEMDDKRTHVSLFVQWLADVNQKVMLENGDPVPVVMLANKVYTNS